MWYKDKTQSTDRQTNKERTSTSIINTCRTKKTGMMWRTLKGLQ